MAGAALHYKLGTVLRMQEEAFPQVGGAPEEIVYDRGEIVCHPVFLDFVPYWGFTPTLTGIVKPCWREASAALSSRLCSDGRRDSYSHGEKPLGCIHRKSSVVGSPVFSPHSAFG
jgi:hypothetical protein